MDFKQSGHKFRRYNERRTTYRIRIDTMANWLSSLQRDRTRGKFPLVVVVKQERVWAAITMYKPCS